MAMASELSQELQAEGHQLYRLESPWGNYIGYRAAIQGVEFVGIRLIGRVKLKGLDNVEIVEIVGLGRDEVKDNRAEDGETLYGLLRQDFHQSPMSRGKRETGRRGTAESRMFVRELLVCIVDGDGAHKQVYMGQWDPENDAILHCLRVAAVQLEFEIGMAPPYSTQLLQLRRKELIERYTSSTREALEESVPLESLRGTPGFRAFVIGESVEVVE
jgi:hypothetical protein